LLLASHWSGAPSIVGKRPLRLREFERGGVYKVE